LQFVSHKLCGEKHLSFLLLSSAYCRKQRAMLQWCPAELIKINFPSVIAALGPDTVTTRTATEPNGPTGVLFEDEDVDTSAARKTLQTENNTSSTTPADKSTSTQKPYRLQIRWRNVFLLGYLHLAALYGLYLTLTSAKLLTTIFCEFGCFFILHT
jgi:hypothetical protein